jgi:hypothetical protein
MVEAAKKAAAALMGSEHVRNTFELPTEVAAPFPEPYFECLEALEKFDEVRCCVLS